MARRHICLANPAQYESIIPRAGANPTMHLHSQELEVIRYQSKPRAVSLACTLVPRRIKPNIKSSPNPINHPFEGKYA